MRNNNSYRNDKNDNSYSMGMNSSFLMFLAGLGTGATLMYFLDPDGGRRRRALMKDQAVELAHDAGEAINATTEDLSNRAYGLYAETQKAVTGNAVSNEGENQLNADRTNQSNTGQEEETSGNTGIGRSAGRR
jgi:hypothetical protein